MVSNPLFLFGYLISVLWLPAATHHAVFSLLKRHGVSLKDILHLGHCRVFDGQSPLGLFGFSITVPFIIPTECSGVAFFLIFLILILFYRSSLASSRVLLPQRRNFLEFKE